MLLQRYQPNYLSHTRLCPQSLLHLQYNSYEVLDHRIRRSSREERVFKELKAVHHQRVEEGGDEVLVPWINL